MLRTMAIFTFFFAMAAAEGVSAESPLTRATIVEELARCREIADASQRLTCYDAAAAAFDTAERAGDLVVLDRQQVQDTQRRLFGFQIGNPFAGRLSGPDEPEIASIETTLMSAGFVGDGKWLFRLEDGSEWRQIDSGTVRFRERQGEPVRIRRASLGSYLMTIGNSRAVRVRRQ